MYQLTVKGNDLEDLRINLNKLNDELNPCSKDVSIPEEVVSETVEEGRPEVMENIIYNDVKKEVSPSINGEELDVEGLPWDKRIHASSKGKVKAGTWRTKRGIEDSYLEEVKKELRAKMHYAANPPVVPEAPITEATPVVETPVVTAPVVETPAIVEAPVAPPVAPSMNGGHTLETFINNFPMVIGSLITEGKIDQDYVNSLKDYFKVDQIWQANTEQMTEIFNTFAEAKIITKVS